MLSCPVVSDSFATPWTVVPHAPLCIRDSPSKNTGVGSLSLLQGIFPTRDQTQVSRIAGGFFTSWVKGKLLLCQKSIYTIPFTCITFFFLLILQESFKNPLLSCNINWIQSMDFLNLRKTDVFELYKENMLFLIVAWKRAYCNLILLTVTNGK